ncbi:MAG TPA: hypothetical protein EYN79_08330 [Planctomycetes bacterium]|nr:hypothetical protein [Planctomycetota bacterium]HIN79837.1 hypothetical protein [Planctomycetota bacterium]
MLLPKQILFVVFVILFFSPLSAQDPGIIASVRSPLDDHQYLLLEASLWTEAEAKAVDLGGNLTAVGDQAEMDWIHDTLNVYGGVSRAIWLGYNDIVLEGTFEWTNGEPAVYTDWNAGEPNNSGNEDMTHTWAAPPFAWNDINELTANIPIHGVVELEPCGTDAPSNVVALSVGSDITFNFTNNGPYTDTFEVWKDGALYATIADPAATSWVDSGICQGSQEYIFHVAVGACHAFTDSIRVTHGFTEYPSTGPSVPIPNNDPVGIASVISVSDIYDINDIDVEVHISHSWVRDLAIAVLSPQGTTVTLKAYTPGVTTDVDDVHTIFDESGIPYDETQLPFNVRVQPEGPGVLDGFAGQPIDGDWILRVSDNEGADEGELQSWSLHHRSGPPCQITAPIAFSSTSVGNDVTLTWDLNGNAYTSIDVYRDGQLAATIGAGEEEWSETVPGSGYYEYFLRCWDNATIPCCVVETGVTGGLINAVDVIWAAEGQGGQTDSVQALLDALIAQGKQPIVVPDILACNCLLTTPTLERVWAMLGTYPDYHCLSGAEGQLLVSLIGAGLDVYIEGGDVWGYCGQTDFAQWDGIGDGVVDGDDSFTSMIGLVWAGIDLTGMDASYNHDQGGNDWTDQLVPADPATPDLAGLESGPIWQQLGLGYYTGNFYATDDPYGEVIAQSWEFGGYSGEQDILVGFYLDAFGAGSGPVGELFRRGDINGDGSVNIADAVTVLNALFVPGSQQPECDDSADANDDGGINIADAVSLLNSLFLPGSPLPPDPGPFDCGIDPTDDGLDCSLYICL